MSNNVGFDFTDLRFNAGAGVALTGAGQVTAFSAGASPVVASGDTPQQAPPSSLNQPVVVGGGHLLTSANALIGGGLYNPSNNAFNPAGH
jgi:hypothetical protein